MWELGLIYEMIVKLLWNDNSYKLSIYSISQTILHAVTLFKLKRRHINVRNLLPTLK